MLRNMNRPKPPTQNSQPQKRGFWGTLFLPFTVKAEIRQSLQAMQASAQKDDEEEKADDERFDRKLEASVDAFMKRHGVTQEQVDAVLAAKRAAPPSRTGPG
jgi:hypothetical protein